MAIEYGFGFEGGSIPSGVEILQGSMRPGVGRGDYWSWGLVDGFTANGAASVEIQVPKVSTPVTQNWYQVLIPDQRDNTYRFLENITVVQDNEFKMMLRNPDTGNGSLIEHYAATNQTGNGTNESALRDLLSRIDGILADNQSTSGLCAVSGREITSVLIADYLGNGPKHVISITIRRNNGTHIRYDSSTSSSTTGRYPFYLAVNAGINPSDITVNYKSQSSEGGSVTDEDLVAPSILPVDVQYSIQDVNSRNVAGSFYTKFDVSNIVATPFYLVRVGDMGIAILNDGSPKLRFTYDVDNAGSTSTDIVIPAVDTGWHSVHFNLHLDTPTTNAATIYWDTEEAFKITPLSAYGSIVAGPNYAGFDKLTLKGLPGKVSTIDDVRVEKEYTRGTAPATIQCVKTSFIDAVVNQWSSRGAPGSSSTGLNIRGMEYCPKNSKFYTIDADAIIWEIDPITYASTQVNTVHADYALCALMYHRQLDRIYMVRNGYYSYFTPGSTSVTEVAEASAIYLPYHYNTGSAYSTTDATGIIVALRGTTGYDHYYGSGYRRSGITVTTSGNFTFNPNYADINCLIDGLSITNSPGLALSPSVSFAVTSSYWFRFDIKSAIVVQNFRIKAQAAGLGSWKFQAYDTGSTTWVDVTSTILTGGTTVTPSTQGSNAYAAYRLIGVTGTWNLGGGAGYELAEIEFDVVDQNTTNISILSVSEAGVQVINSNVEAPGAKLNLGVNTQIIIPHITTTYSPTNEQFLFPLWNSGKVGILDKNDVLSFSANHGTPVRWLVESPALYDELSSTTSFLAGTNNGTSKTQRYSNGTFTQYSTMQVHNLASIYDRGFCYHPWLGIICHADNTTATTLSYILKSSGRMVTGQPNVLASTDVLTGKVNPVTGAILYLTNSGTLNSTANILNTGVGNLLIKDSKFVEEGTTNERLIPVTGTNIPSTKIILSSNAVVDDVHGQGTLNVSNNSFLMSRTKKVKTSTALASDYQRPDILFLFDSATLTNLGGDYATLSSPTMTLTASSYGYPNLSKGAYAYLSAQGGSAFVTQALLHTMAPFSGDFTLVLEFNHQQTPANLTQLFYLNATHYFNYQNAYWGGVTTALSSTIPHNTNVLAMVTRVSGVCYLFINGVQVWTQNYASVITPLPSISLLTSYNPSYQQVFGVAAWKNKGFTTSFPLGKHLITPLISKL